MVYNTTMYRGIHIMDLFTVTGSMLPAQKDWKVVPATCLCLAEKLEGFEIRNVFTSRELFQMECQILKGLHFEVNVPVPSDFVNQFLCAVPNNKFLEDNAKPLCSSGTMLKGTSRR